MSSIGRISSCAVAVLVATAPALRAQAPAERVALAQLLDSTPTAVAPSPASTASPAYDEILRGLWLLDSAARTDDRDELDAAQAAFDEAIYRAPDDWPWPWYGLALTDLALDSADYPVKPSMHQPAGVYYRDAAIHALSKALEADSTFTPAASLLAKLLTPFASTDFDAEVEQAVRRATNAGAGAPAWLALGRVFRNRGSPDSAVQAFRHYLWTGGDSGIGWLELARSLSATAVCVCVVCAY